MKPLPKNYEHKEAEARWQRAWEEKRVHAWRDDQPRDNTYVIDTPPPTVSGVLHMGHIFSYTQADFVARYKRMKGMDVFYPMGFDDNGLPTERLVEKDKKIRAVNMSREEFIELCQQVTKEYEDQFRDMFKSVALSVDWKQEYLSISESARRISQMSFLDLYNKGHAYRDFRPTYWDWVDQTAIAQAEVENKELPGTMSEIEFTLEGDEPLIIMTTRPELLGACVAVMYHPEDPNAAKYKDKHAITPLFGVKVPMIADEMVEREKGTGVVMCCTFGDDTDKEWWKKHELPMRTLLDLNGKIRYVGFGYDGAEHSDDQITSIIFLAGKDGRYDQSQIWERNCVDIKKAVAAYKQIEGLKPKQASAKVLELLQAAGKLIKQTQIMHTVKCAERSGTPIEIIPTLQWYVRIIDKKEELKQRGEQCVWHPEFMRIRLDQWIDGLKEDWCISRQRYSGVPFPVWYVTKFKEPENKLYGDGQVVVIGGYRDDPGTLKIVVASPDDNLPINPLNTPPKGYIIDGNHPGQGQGSWAGIEEATGEKVVIWADKDIMDTWATSSVSPQVNSQGINKELSVDPVRHAKLFPADLRPQAHEIIRTWAFYTIVKAHLHENTIPWNDLMISGWCLAADKTKMSKSKGNVITPVELIVDKGADAVRYWASTSRLGADTAFSEDLLKIGRKLVTKLWNATAFASIHLSKLAEKPQSAIQDVASGRITETLDLAILTRLQRAVDKATIEFERYEYCDARVAIEEFFWKDFCDNYLELVKARAYGESGDAQAQRSAHYTLYHCLDAILRLFAPFIPHVTEELYSHLFEEQYQKLGSIHARGNWPQAGDYPVDEKAELAGLHCVSVLNAVRKAKSERNVSIKYPIDELVLSPAAETANWKLLQPVLLDLKGAGNIGNITWNENAKGELMSEDGLYGLSPTFAAQSDENKAASA